MVLVLRFFLVLVLSGNYSLYAASRSIEDLVKGMSPLGTAFARVMTKGYENFVVPHGLHHRAFMNKHWVNRWVIHKEVKSSQLYRHTLAIDQNGPVAEFHRLLSKEFIAPEGKPTKNAIVHTKFRIAKKEEPEILRPYLDGDYRTSSSCFLEGHEIEFSDVELDSPMVAVSMYQHADYKNKKGPTTKPWWIPIEQIFWYPTLKDYRNAASLLKVWGPYSNLAVAVFPKGALMKFKAGLFAPKIFPTPLDPNDAEGKGVRDNIKYDLEARIAFNLAGFEEEDHMEHVTEFLKGGALQFYVRYAEPAFVFDIGSVIKLNDERVINSKKKQLGTKLWYRESEFREADEKEEKEKFYLHKSSPYDDSKVDLVTALHKAGIITPEVAREFNTVIKEVVLDNYPAIN